MKNNKKEIFLFLNVFRKDVHLDKSPIEKVSMVKIIVANFCDNHSRRQTKRGESVGSALANTLHSYYSLFLSAVPVLVFLPYIH